MSRKRVTQIFPFLLPIRKWQRKKLFYLQMCLDKNRYARVTSNELLEFPVFDTSFLMLNENSGFDMKFQYNKIHNLRLASKRVDKIVIRSGETFSFWQLVRNADKYKPYKDGLNFVNGKIVTDYGGGLCLLSDMLFWLFLHTPMDVVERHSHSVLSFPPATDFLPCGTDATVNEGWLDLKVKNETENTFQIEIHFDEKYMYGCILSDKEIPCNYEVYNQSISYFRQGGRIYQSAVICRTMEDKHSHVKTDEELYCNQCEIAYSLPENTYVEERGA